MDTYTRNGQHVLEDKYTLPRNDSERERLEAQHACLTEALGGRLIIDNTIKLLPGSRILDSGTGAGSWTLDLLRKVNYHLEAVGIDISGTMFPKDVPGNARLYQMSSLNLPAEWTNYFDLANQRMLIAAFTESQWLLELAELFRVLKPGGVVQLVEVGHLQSLHGADIPPATRRVIRSVVALFKHSDILGYDVGKRLPEMLERVGFSDIRVEYHRAPLGKSWGDIGIRCARNWVGVYKAFGASCFELGGLGVCESLSEGDTAVESARREWDEVPGIFIRLYAITARKPSASVQIIGAKL